jgi:hypothetical protein
MTLALHKPSQNEATLPFLPRFVLRWPAERGERRGDHCGLVDVSDSALLEPPLEPPDGVPSAAVPG